MLTNKQRFFINNQKIQSSKRVNEPAVLKFNPYIYQQSRKEFDKLQKTIRIQKAINQYAAGIDKIALNDLPSYIVEKATNIFDAKFAFTTHFNSSENTFSFAQTNLKQNVIIKICRIAGFNIFDRKIKIKPEDFNTILKDKVVFFQSVYEVSLKNIPKTIACSIDKIINVGWFICASFIADEKLFGSITLAGKPDQEFIERENLLIFSHITTQAIRRKQAEMQLRQSQANMLALLENTGDAIWALNNDFKIFYANSRFKALLYDLYNITWKNNIDVFSQLSTSETLFWKSIINKGLSNHQMIIEKKVKIGELQKIFQISVNPIFEDNKQIGLSFFASDITSHKRSLALEQELELANKTMELKQNFLANLSHEIRTPLAGVMGITELLALTKLDDKQTEYLKMLKDSGSNLKDVIDLILDYSNIKRGNISAGKVVFSLKDIFYRKIGKFSANNEKSVTFQYSHGKEVPDLIKGDQLLISKVVDNLLQNAYKFTDNGLIELKTSIVSDHNFLNLHKLTTPAESDVWIRFEVSDTGTGVSNYVKEHIFKPFMNLEKNSARQYEGTGLGLALCKEIVDQMGGKIGYESSANKGSVFWFTIKVTRKQKIEICDKIHNKIPEANKSSKNGIKIAYIGFSRLNQKLVNIALSYLGYHATHYDGRNIITQEFNHTSIPDILIIDYDSLDSMDVSKFNDLFNSPISRFPKMIGLLDKADNVETMIKKGIHITECLYKPLKTHEISPIIKRVVSEKCN
ncbi:MAG: ATP-binding protein [Bacteroidales bacterium]